MNRVVWCLGLAMVGACGGGSGGELPDVLPEPVRPEPVRPQTQHLALAEAGDSVLYLVLSNGLTMIDRSGDTLIVTTRQTAVVDVQRVAPDTLLASFDYLHLQYARDEEEHIVDTGSLLDEPFVLHEDDGRIETVSAPRMSPQLRQLSDLRQQFDDFFLRLPDRPLEVGVTWADTLESSAIEGESRAGRLAVTRFVVRADTVLDEIPARVIDYETAIEMNLRSAPSTQGTLISTMAGGEEGTFVYAPERDLMLRRRLIGVLEGEVVVEGNLETQRFPQSYTYDTTIELILPGGPGRPSARTIAEP